MSGLLSAGEGTRDKAGWVTPVTCRSFPAALFPVGVVFMWLEAHLPWDQNRHFNHETGGLQGSWWWADGSLCVTAHVEMNTCFVINPWKSVMWHGEIEVSAPHASSRSRGAYLPRDKHPLTSAGGHIAAPSNLLLKLDVFFKHQRYCEFFKSLGTAVANCLISFMVHFLFEHECTN